MKRLLFAVGLIVAIVVVASVLWPPPARAFAVQYGYVQSASIADVDSSGNICLSLRGTMVNGTQRSDFQMMTGYFAATLTNYHTNLTTAVVNQYQAVFDVTLSRTSVILPQLEAGQ